MKVKLKTLEEVINEGNVLNVTYNFDGCINHIIFKNGEYITYHMTKNFGNILGLNIKSIPDLKFTYKQYDYYMGWVEKVIKHEKFVRIPESEKDKIYYFIGHDGKVSDSPYIDTYNSDCRIEGNLYAHNEEGHKEAKKDSDLFKLIRLMKADAERAWIKCGKEIDWDDPNQIKWYFGYDVSEKEIRCDFMWDVKMNIVDAYFPNEKSLKKSTNKHELLIYKVFGKE